MEPQQDQPAEKPHFQPWLFRSTTSEGSGCLLILGALFLAPLLLITVGPWLGLPMAILSLYVYNRCRYGGRSFGPMWLELVDGLILSGNFTIAVVSIIVIIRRLLPLFQLQ